jgi:hypothetical protein
MKGQVQAYLEELRALGKDTSSPKLAGGHFWLIVTNDPEKSWREISPHVLYQINMYAEWLCDPFPRNGEEPGTRS